MPSPLPERSDGAIIATAEQRAREASRPPDERWCLWCVADGPPHEPGCPMVREGQMSSDSAFVGPVLAHLRCVFTAKYSKDGACWEWHGGKNHRGYGVTTVHALGQSRQLRAHRLAWVLANGPIPEGLMVCHKCDNPPCCNPEHLFLGTPRDNVLDAIQKGRRPRRTNFPKRRYTLLTADAVRAIRRDYASGMELPEIAEGYRISVEHSRHVVKGESWAQVKEGICELRRTTRQRLKSKREAMEKEKR